MRHSTRLCSSARSAACRNASAAARASGSPAQRATSTRNGSPSLADSRLAGDQHHPAGALPSPDHRLAEDIKLLVTPYHDGLCHPGPILSVDTAARVVMEGGRLRRR